MQPMMGIPEQFRYEITDASWQYHQASMDFALRVQHCRRLWLVKMLTQLWQDASVGRIVSRGGSPQQWLV